MEDKELNKCAKCGGSGYIGFINYEDEGFLENYASGSITCSDDDCHIMIEITFYADPLKSRQCDFIRSQLVGAWNILNDTTNT